MSRILVTRNVYDMIVTTLANENNTVFETTLSTGETVHVNKHNASKTGIRGMFYKLCHFGCSRGTVKIVAEDQVFAIVDRLRTIASSR